MLVVLTQKPPFSTGNLRLLTSAATLEAALQEEPQASHSENGNQPKQRTVAEEIRSARIGAPSSPKRRFDDNGSDLAVRRGVNSLTRTAEGRSAVRQHDRGVKLRRKHEAMRPSLYSLRMLHYGVSSGRLHVTIPGVAPWLPVQSAGLLQSVCPPARRFVPIVRGCAREGYGRSRFGYPTRAQRRLRLKPIVNRRWWHGARMRDGTRILSMQSQCNRVGD
jgi:hypothetical protein